MSTLLRQHAEQQFAEELHELKQNETNPVPENWEMSPQSVVTYLMGGKLKNGFEVSPKYIGNRRLMEIAVATLVTDRALLLYGLPGTAKSWVSEHIAAPLWVELCPFAGGRSECGGIGANSGNESYAGR